MLPTLKPNRADEMQPHAISPTCIFKDKCANTLCQFRHEINEPNDQSIEEQHTFKHISTSTPMKDDSKGNQCKICIQNIYTGQKIFKCENCAMKTQMEDDPDFFMCLVCQ